MSTRRPHIYEKPEMTQTELYTLAEIIPFFIAFHLVQFILLQLLAAPLTTL